MTLVDNSKHPGLNLKPSYFNGMDEDILVVDD